MSARSLFSFPAGVISTFINDPKTNLNSPSFLKKTSFSTFNVKIKMNVGKIKDKLQAIGGVK
jgi:hypothetical protein